MQTNHFLIKRDIGGSRELHKLEVEGAELGEDVRGKAALLVEVRHQMLAHRESFCAEKLGTAVFSRTIQIEGLVGESVQGEETAKKANGRLEDELATLSADVELIADPSAGL